MVNYYVPNAENEQVKVLIQIKNILDNLEISQDTSVILGGDFNLFFEKSLDTDVGNPSVKTKSLSKLQEIMTEMICVTFLEYATLRNGVSSYGETKILSNNKD